MRVCEYTVSKLKLDKKIKKVKNAKRKQKNGAI